MISHSTPNREVVFAQLLSEARSYLVSSFVFDIAGFESVLTLYLISACLLLATAFVIFRVSVRGDYQRVGRLRPLTTFLEFLIWGAFVCFHCIYNPSDWWLVWFADSPVGLILRIIGSVLIIVGMAVTIFIMGTLGACRTMGQREGTLEWRGLYRVSRNPQIVGFGLEVVGIALLWPSWYAL